MSLIKPTSLAATLDAVGDAFFWKKPVASNARTQAATWIAERFGEPHAYADTFALFDDERKIGWKLFTGERVQSAAARHVAGEEACRALRLLKSADGQVKTALRSATRNLQKCLDQSEADTEHRMGGRPGVFCCGTCTVSVWRHILSGGFDRRPERLASGLAALKAARSKPNEGWRRFPFWYTVSALVEMNLDPARAELRHVAPRLERTARRRDNESAYEARQHELSRRALMQI